MCLMGHAGICVCVFIYAYYIRKILGRRDDVLGGTAHPSIHSCIYGCMHTCIHTYEADGLTSFYTTNAYMYAYIHTNIHTCTNGRWADFPLSHLRFHTVGGLEGMAEELEVLSVYVNMCMYVRTNVCVRGCMYACMYHALPFT